MRPLADCLHLDMGEAQWVLTERNTMPNYRILPFYSKKEVDSRNSTLSELLQSVFTHYQCIYSYPGIYSLSYTCMTTAILCVIIGPLHLLFWALHHLQSDKTFLSQENWVHWSLQRLCASFSGFESVYSALSCCCQWRLFVNASIAKKYFSYLSHILHHFAILPFPLWNAACGEQQY